MQSLSYSRAGWRRWRVSGLNGWALVALLLSLMVAAPIFAVAIAALQDYDAPLWAHLLDTVLLDYFVNSLLLTAGACGLACVFGISGAWVVARYRFFGHVYMEWLLLLPAAVPAYIVAYTYTDFFEYAGPVQSLWRDIFGFSSPRDYRFFEIRSLGGAILVMGSVLYPYVYLPARTAFRLLPASLCEVAQLYSRSLFWTVALPIARPAVLAGLALVAMETISDFGAVEYFAVPTLTLGVFNVWQGMHSLSAAAQISLIAFVLIFGLLGLETYYRGLRRFSFGHARAGLSVRVLRGWRAVLCIFVCLLPLFLGFVIPVGVLLSFILRGYIFADLYYLWDVAFGTVSMALLAMLVIGSLALLLNLIRAYKGNRLVSLFVFVAVGGYAFPGTMLALGSLTLSGLFDSGWVWFGGFLGGMNVEGILAGSFGLLLLAYVARFNAAAYGVIRDGVLKLPPHAMDAGLVLGRGFLENLRKICFPLLRASVLSGFLLVFVDVMKELPMTLLLRPFNFETLATFTYQYAHSELLEEAALPALLIVVVGLLPVLFMNFLLRVDFRRY